MPFSCPACNQPLQGAPLPGSACDCPHCGQRIRELERERLLSPAPPGAISPEIGCTGSLLPSPSDDEGRLDVSLSQHPRARWPRLLSPSLMLLALLMLPLPWVEVSCGRTGYSQTGLQMLADDPPVQADTPRASRPLRQVGAILWAVSLVAGVILALAGRRLACNIAQVCCAAVAAVLLPCLIGLVALEEALHTVTWMPWPIVACVASLAAMASSLVTLLHERPRSTTDPPAHMRDWLA